MSFLRDTTIGLALLAMAITPITPLSRGDTVHHSPIFAGTTLMQGDVVRSGDDCTELRFFLVDGYYNRLDLRGVGGGGCGNSNWDSYSDFDWQGYGHGLHGSSLEPRGVRFAQASMQDDGNFVVYDLQDGVAVPVWSTHTDGNPGAYLNVQGDGNLVIYSASNAVLWSLF